jgi:hypothetical protein
LPQAHTVSQDLHISRWVRVADWAVCPPWQGLAERKQTGQNGQAYAGVESAQDGLSNARIEFNEHQRPGPGVTAQIYMRDAVPSQFREEAHPSRDDGRVVNEVHDALRPKPTLRCVDGSLNRVGKHSSVATQRAKADVLTRNVALENVG